MSKKSKQLGLQEIYVHMGTFDFAVYGIIGEYEKALEYVAWKFEDEKLPDANDLCRGYAPRGQCLFKRGYTPIIWVPRKPQTPREFATLSHECLHAVMHLFDWADIPTNSSTEEVMTHAMSHLITNILSKAKP